MKRLVVVVFLIFLWWSAWSQVTIHNRNDAPLAWDPIAATETVIDIDGDGEADTDVEGDQIVESIISLEYRVGRSLDPVADRSTPETILGQTAVAIYTDDVPGDGQLYIYSVQAVYTTASGVSYSPWNWSDQNGEATPDPFGFRDSSLTVPDNFRRQ